MFKMSIVFFCCLFFIAPKVIDIYPAGVLQIEVILGSIEFRVLSREIYKMGHNEQKIAK